MMFIVYSKSDIAKYIGRFGTKRPVSWLYLSSDYIRMRQIEQQLGASFSRIDISRLHEDVACELRKPFIKWMDNLNVRNGSDLEWWFGSIASRNVYCSNLFQYICYLEILQRIIKGGGEQPSFVVVQSYGLMESVVLWVQSLGITVSVLGRCKAKWDCRLQSLREYTNVARFIAKSAWYVAAACCTRLFYGKKTTNADATFLIDTFILENCLSKEGVYKDRYFPGIREFIRKKGLDVIIHPVLCVSAKHSWSVFKRMRRSDAPFIIQEDFLRITDYFSAVAYVIRMSSRCIVASRCEGFNLMPILKEEQRTCFTKLGMDAVLTYKLYARLGRRGIQPKTVLKWYENQAIDKAVVAGVRAFMPSARVVGAQMYAHSKNHLSVFPSKSEYDFGIIPDELLQMSKRQCEIVNGYLHEIQCRAAASLRYAYIFQRGNDLAENPIFTKKAIVILLPGIREEAVELMEVAREGLATLPESVPIYVKGHPSFGVQHPREAYGIEVWPERFEVVEGSMHTVLRQALVVVSSNSVTMVEAVAMGIPVIFIARQTALNMNPLDGEGDDILTKCYSQNELQESVKSYLAREANNSSRGEISKISRIQRYFTEISEETIEPYITLC